MTDADLWALGTDARELLDKFAVERVTGRYRQADLETIVRRLAEVAG